MSAFGFVGFILFVHPRAFHFRKGDWVSLLIVTFHLPTSVNKLARVSAQNSAFFTTTENGCNLDLMNFEWKRVKGNTNLWHVMSMSSHSSSQPWFFPAVVVFAPQAATSVPLSDLKEAARSVSDDGNCFLERSFYVFDVVWPIWKTHKTDINTYKKSYIICQELYRLWMSTVSLCVG